MADGQPGTTGEVVGRLTIDVEELRRLVATGVPVSLPSGAPLGAPPGVPTGVPTGTMQRPAAVTPDAKMREILKPLMALSVMGIGIAALVKNSQVLNTMTSVFSQTLGAIMDLILLPLMPVFFRVEWALLKLVEIAAKTGQVFGEAGTWKWAALAALLAPSIAARVVTPILTRLGVGAAAVGLVSRVAGAAGIAGMGAMVGGLGPGVAKEMGAPRWAQDLTRALGFIGGGALAGARFGPVGAAVGAVAGAGLTAYQKGMEPIAPGETPGLFQYAIGGQRRGRVGPQVPTFFDWVRGRGGAETPQGLAQAQAPGGVNFSVTNNISVTGIDDPKGVAEAAEKALANSKFWEQRAGLSPAGQR